MRARAFGGAFGFEAGDDVGDRGGLVEVLHGHAAPIAAEFVDGAVQFVPQRMGRVEAEIAADVGEDSADGLTADSCGDLLGGGQVGEGGIEGSGTGQAAPWRRRLGLAGESAWRAWGWRGLGLGFGVEARGNAGDLFLEQAGAQQTLFDAGEDQRDVSGEEDAEIDGIGVGGARTHLVGELSAVVDEPADEREEAAGAAWFG